MSSPVPILEMPPSSGRGWSRSRVVFLAISGIAVVVILAWAREVLLPFILALIIAYVLTPLVALCERIHVPRALAIILVYAATFSTIYYSVAAIAPRVYDEAVQLSRETPALARRLAERWGPVVERHLRGLLERGEPAAPRPPEPEPGLLVTKRPDGSFAVDLRSGVEIVQETPKRWRIQPVRSEPLDLSVSGLMSRGVDETAGYVRRNALELIKVGQAIVSKISRGIFLLFMTLMVAGYLMHTRDDILGFFRTLPPAALRPSFDRLIHRIDRGLAGVVRGQLLICLVNGVLSAIGFWLFGLKYWPILSIIAAIMSIIPIFGSILSTIPAVAIGLTQDFWTALWVLLWILGIHQVEANLLNPNIIGVAAKVHPVLVVFSLFVGEHFFGLWGALLAVPALSLLQSIFLHFRYESMPDAGPDSLLPPVAKKG
jgi:predicted PurR-regulated permease PerM